MRSRRFLVAGAVLALGMIAAIACESSIGTGGESAADRSPAPDFTIPVVRATGADGFETGQFTLSEERGRPFVLYFSFPG